MMQAVANVNGRNELVAVLPTFESDVVRVVGFGLFNASDIVKVPSLFGGTHHVLRASVWHPIDFAAPCDVRGCCCN